MKIIIEKNFNIITNKSSPLYKFHNLGNIRFNKALAEAK